MDTVVMSDDLARAALAPALEKRMMDGDAARGIDNAAFAPTSPHPQIVIPAVPPPTFWQGVLDDLHVNLSGLVLFACVVIGIIWPDQKPKTDQIAVAAATYLFASAKNKPNA